VNRTYIATALLIVSTSVAALMSAQAANVQFKQKQSPNFTDQGLTLTAQGALVGLGNQDLVILLKIGRASCRERV